jgi:CRP-like cAMP-binding protein
MRSASQGLVANRLLQAISVASFARLQPHLELVELPLKFLLVHAGQPTEFVYFLESGLGSIVADSLDDKHVEVGHVGREGMGGSHLILRTDVTPDQTFMQVGGSGFRMSVAHFNAVMLADIDLRDLLSRYVLFCKIQLAQSAVANARYSLHARLARWLLMCHDRLEIRDMFLTHQFLSLMLGVRRPGVTEELHVLEGAGLIKSTRGKIRILDRAGLEQAAGGCYGLPELEYERLIGVPMRAERSGHQFVT